MQTLSRIAASGEPALLGAGMQRCALLPQTCRTFSRVFCRPSCGEHSTGS